MKRVAEGITRVAGTLAVLALLWTLFRTTEVLEAVKVGFMFLFLHNHLRDEWRDYEEAKRREAL